MAGDRRTRTRNYLGLDPLKGQPKPAQRSAYARFTAPGDDTTSAQLLAGALLYAAMTVFCIALVLGSTGTFGRVVFAILGVLGFAFAMHRAVLLLNRRGDDVGDHNDEDQWDSAPGEPRSRPATSSRTGGGRQKKRSRGEHRSGDPRQRRAT